MPNEMPMMDCEQALAQLFDFLDHELTPERMQLIEQHLAGCTCCFELAQFEERFLVALQGIREDRPCPHEVRRRVLASLEAAGFTRH